MNEKRLRLGFLKALSENVKKTHNPNASMYAGEVAEKLGCSVEQVELIASYLKDQGLLIIPSQQGGLYRITAEGRLFAEENTRWKHIWKLVWGFLKPFIPLLK